MFSLSLHSGTGERELHHDHYLAVHSAEVPYIHLGPHYPYPDSAFSWLKRWGGEAGWAFKPSLGENLEPNANLLKSYSNLKGSKKRKDHGIWSHHFMGNRWGNSGNTVRLYFLGSKISADGDCSHEIKRRLLLGRKVMNQPR